MSILWLYFITWDWFRKHLINLLVLRLWSWCCLCFVVLPVAPHPDHVIDKQWCLQVFPCIRLSQHSALKLLKEKVPQFQMHRKWISFLHSWLSLTLSWHCELRNYFCYLTQESWWIWTSVMGQLFLKSSAYALKANHGTASHNSWGGRAPLGILWCNPWLKIGSVRTGRPEPYRLVFWISPRTGQPVQPLLQ